MACWQEMQQLLEKIKSTFVADAADLKTSQISELKKKQTT